MPAKDLTYESTGVSVDANDALVRRIQRIVKRTHDASVLSNLDHFAGFFRLHGQRQRYKDPVLVGCSDGVGSKVLLALQARRLGSIGIDLVAMNVNDLITSGAQPLFFLDYIALHRNVPERTAEIVGGIARGCREAGCALLGGETAEMPDLYRKGHCDLAGFAVGVVERKKIITGQKMRPGDLLLGLASSGLHSNGYTLVRKLFFEAHRYTLSSKIRGLRVGLGRELLRPTRIYTKPILTVLKKNPSVIRGMAHITGGGLPGNLPRILPSGCRAVVRKKSWKTPPIFRIMQSLGVAESEMYRVFNMGIGFVLVVRAKAAVVLLRQLKRLRVPACRIGEIIKGRRAVEFVS